MEDNKTPDVPMPCTAGCGFYGNKIYNYMCSKCFREQANRTTQTGSDNSAKTTLPVPASSTNIETQKQPSEDNLNKEAVAAKSTIDETSNDQQPPSKPVQKNVGRCFLCRAKIPLAKQLSNKCRCEYVFCDTHRYPDKHECNFDHASMDKDILAKKNPKLNERPRGGRSFQRLDSM